MFNRQSSIINDSGMPDYFIAIKDTVNID